MKLLAKLTWIGGLALTTAAFAQVHNKDGVRVDASLSLKQMYDTNVMLQSEGPLKNFDSPVTVAVPSIGLTLDKPLGFSGTLKLDYTLAASYYCNQSDESNLNHSFLTKFSGKHDNWSYEATNALILIDGDSDSFFAFSPDGVPAIGAPAVRDRRDQLLYRGTNKLQYTADQWFLRGIADGYYVDFGTRQQNIPFYFNTADRADVNGGLDGGWKIYKDTFFVVGHRYGYQWQGQVLQGQEWASNTYHRALFGAEGKPFDWLKFNFLIGPDCRDYDSQAPQGISSTKLYFEGSVTVTPTPQDEIAFVGKHWTLPASGGRTVYDDSLYDLGWKHRWTSQLSSGVGVKVTGGEWSPPAHRYDWVFAPRLTGEYQLNKNVTFEAGSLYEIGYSADRSATGRGYNRLLAWLGVKLQF